MNKTLVIACLLAGSILLNGSMPAFAGSLLTSSKEFSKAATYGINFATYTAEKKSGKDAMDKLLLFDVLWDVMGKGEEILLNGDPDAFSGFKDNVLKVKLVIDKVGEVAEKLGAGVYDEALISSVDGIVGLVNHPVVNAFWEAVKLTYESHKLLESTRVALEIETLYGVVNGDRRLMGTISDSRPPLIPVNTETVSYFFNKYLITNGATRNLVKTYVKNKLGEDFPELELSAGSSMWAYVTGTTATLEKEYELQQLQEFENNSRRWIKELLEDLNKQVTTQWAQARLRQQQASFKLFASQFGKAFGSMDEVFAYYMKVKKLEKEKEQYPAKLAELKQAKEKAEAAYGSLKPKEYDQKLAIRQALFKISTTANVYAVNSMIASADGLQESFEGLQIDCLKSIQRIDKEIEQSGDDIVEAIHAPPENSSITYQQYEASMLASFKGCLDGLAATLPRDIKSPIDEIKNLLAANKYNDGRKVYFDWHHEEEAKYSKALTRFNDEFISVAEQKPDYRAHPIIQSLQSKNKKITEGIIADAKKSRDDYWQAAQEKTTKAKNAIYSISSLEFAKESGRITAMFDYYSQEVSLIRATVGPNISLLKEFYREVYYPGQYGTSIQLSKSFPPSDATWYPSLHYTARQARDYLQENRYTSIGTVPDEGVSLKVLGAYIKGKKESIMAPLRWHREYMSGLSHIDAELYRLDALKSKWKAFVKLDDKTISAYNDLARYNTPEQASEDEMNIHLGTAKRDTSSISNWVKIDYYSGAVRKMNEFMSNINTGSIRAEANGYLASVETDLENRERDYDYLDRLETQWNTWYQKLEADHMIHYDHTAGKYLPGYGSGFRQAEGYPYARVLKPYDHFALKEELGQNEKLLQAKASLVAMPVYGFIQSSMPHSKIALDEFFSASLYEPAPEENFLLGKYPVWKKDLKEARKIISRADAEKEDSFIEAMKELSELLPFTISFPELTEKDKDSAALKFQNKYGKFNDGLATYDYEKFELGREYIKVREQIRELYIKKGQILEKERYAKSQQQFALERLEGYRKEFALIQKETQRLAQGEQTTASEVHEHYQVFWALRTKYSNDPEAKSSSFDAALIEHDAIFTALSNRLESKAPQSIQAIRDMYSQFKGAYESKDEHSVVYFLSKDWDAQDGTTISDLEDNFRNMFSVFDDISYTLSNLQIQPLPEGQYRTSYDVNIIGKIYETDITHEENSSVREVVGKNEKGEFVILKTLQGTFWY